MKTNLDALAKLKREVHAYIQYAVNDEFWYELAQYPELKDEAILKYQKTCSCPVEEATAQVEKFLRIRNEKYNTY